ncbi:MAG: alanine--tRNA ligase, partial [Candidatus Aenigmarchaeota archaeon]|nr:alanine--tRNA ligase [Candidatus Aenigmarchaeota archaeon]
MPKQSKKVSKKISFDDIRSRYFQFFKKLGHTVIPSVSLVPENDPTTLFTGFGMQPLIPYLAGLPHPMGKRLCNSQKSFRADDIMEVGDNRHTTFFEMLGNWSLGDYFKEEQLSWIFKFMTEELKIDPKKLYVSVFSGDEKNKIPKDNESIGIWKKLFKKKGIDAKPIDVITKEKGSKLGMQGGRIFSYDAKKNWWSRSGAPENMPSGELGGPDSEVFYEFTSVKHDTKYGKKCHPNCDCGRFLEIGNSVFMEYKKSGGRFEKLKQKNVDFGGGLERIAAAMADNPDMFRNDVFQSLFDEIKERHGWNYSDASEKEKRVMRIVADHMRAAVFIIGDNVFP